MFKPKHKNARIIKLLTVVAVLLFSTAVMAQTTETIIVRAGHDIGSAISPGGHYRYTQFTEGVVTMKNGTKSKARLNFHLCNSEMQFIDAKGDTLAIAQTQNIENIIIGGNTEFIFADKAYYEIVAESSAGKLGKRLKVQITNDKKTAYGQSDPNGSHDQVSDFIYGHRVVSLAYDVEVKKTTNYFWVDNKNFASPATKKNLLKLVKSDKREKLLDYINQNGTNFNNEEDLRKVLAYVATL